VNSARRFYERHGFVLTPYDITLMNLKALSLTLAGPDPGDRLDV
jgi:hypothetical protein